MLAFFTMHIVNIAGRASAELGKYQVTTHPGGGK